MLLKFRDARLFSSCRLLGVVALTWAGSGRANILRLVHQLHTDAKVGGRSGSASPGGGEKGALRRRVVPVCWKQLRVVEIAQVDRAVVLVRRRRHPNDRPEVQLLLFIQRRRCRTSQLRSARTRAAGPGQNAVQQARRTPRAFTDPEQAARATPAGSPFPASHWMAPGLLPCRRATHGRAICDAFCLWRMGVAFITCYLMQRVYRFSCCGPTDRLAATRLCPIVRRIPSFEASSRNMA